VQGRKLVSGHSVRVRDMVVAHSVYIYRCLQHHDWMGSRIWLRLSRSIPVAACNATTGWGPVYGYGSVGLYLSLLATPRLDEVPGYGP
jgi:hypothetical protein